jgi:hypothetical protein
MKYTVLFLKYLALAVLAAAMLLGFATFGVSMLVAVLGFAFIGNPQYLLLFLVAVAGAFVGFVLLDIMTRVAQYWGLCQ